MSTVSSSEKDTVSISVLAQLVRYLRYLDADIAGIFMSQGVDPAVLDAPDERIDVEKYIAIEEEAARVTGDLYFGLHMGEFAEPGSWSILGYMMMNCRNLRDAAEKVGRYQKIIGNQIEGSVQLSGLGRVKSVMSSPPGAPVSRHCFESAMSSGFRIMRTITGQDISPLEVGFAYPAPGPINEYKRIFRCPVLFEQKQNYHILDISVGSIPVVMSNPGLLEHFETYARKMIAEIEEARSVTRTVTRLIVSRLETGSITIGGIAQEMAMSVRTLQAHLEREGTVFRELLQQTRESLAKRYIQENYTVEDITCLLGFSDSSAFRKAFKKWSGLTPREFRLTGPSAMNPV